MDRHLIRKVLMIVGLGTLAVGTYGAYRGYRMVGDAPAWSTIVTVVGVTLFWSARRWDIDPPSGDPPEPRPDV